MAATIIYDDQTSHVPNASADGDNLWIPVQDLRRATGWELKSEGACLGDQCVPIGQGRELETVSKDGAGFNLAAFARMLRQAVVHDEASGVWVFGRAGADGQRKLQSLVAPDFSLPDLDGKMHSLSEHRGKKVFLVTWASW
jgi:hypothetical protein